MSVIHLEAKKSALEDIFEEKLYPILLKCGTKWCKPCKEIAPFFEELSHEYNGKDGPFLTFVAIDEIDKSPLLCKELSVKKVPTFLVLAKNGDKLEIRNRLEGASQTELTLFASKNAYHTIVKVSDKK